MMSQSDKYRDKAVQGLSLTRDEAEVLMIAVVQLYVAHGHELNERSLDILSEFEQRIKAQDIDLWEKWKSYD